MAVDPTYNTSNYSERGGAVEVIAGELKIESTGKITAAGTQAALISDPTGGATTDTQARAAIVSILTALKGVGIIASS